MKTVFAVNRDVEEAVGLTLDPRAVPRVTGAALITVAGHPGAAGTSAGPGTVRPRRTEVEPGEPLRITLPPVSWNVIRLTF